MRSTEVTRRQLLRWGAWGMGAAGLGIAGTTSLSGCTTRDDSAQEHSYIRATDPEVAAAEAARWNSGRTVAHRLSCEPGVIALGAGLHASTWGYREDAALAALGPTIHASRGDRLSIAVENQLPEDTSVHWHGLRLRNDMDGAPPDTQQPILPGDTFNYSFVAPDHGTYWYHSHSGLQADRGLLGAVVIEDPEDASGATVDVVVVLDDWLDGIAGSPEAVLSALGPDTGGGHAGHGSGGSTTGDSVPDAAAGLAAALVADGVGKSELLGGPSQHISYPHHLMNGRTPDDPQRWSVAPGSRVRLRIINAAAETPYRFAVAGHRPTIIAADGWDTIPLTTDAVLIAPAQRIDLLVDLSSGVWPVVAAVEGRPGAALGVLATADATGATPHGAAATRIAELDRRVVTDADLRPAEAARLSARDPDQVWRLQLIQAENGYQWGIGGDTSLLLPKLGERIRIEMANTTTMWHPMHLHGHTYASATHGGLRRDTSVVLPGETLTIDFDADNPGHWMLHCHNAYHFAAGMTAPLRYVR